MALTAPTTALMTFDEHVDLLHRSGFVWHRSDHPVISLDTAQTALAVLEEKIAAMSPYATIREAIAARDELQTAICRAVEAG